MAGQKSSLFGSFFGTHYFGGSNRLDALAGVSLIGKNPWHIPEKTRCSYRYLG